MAIMLYANNEGLHLGFRCTHTESNHNIIGSRHGKNVSSGICRQRRPRSACASAQSDQGLLCPRTMSLDTTEYMNMESKGTDNILHMRRMICLRMFEGTFLLDTAHIIYSTK